MDRREFLKGTLLTAWASRRVAAQRLTDKFAIVDGGGTNVLTFSTDDGLVLVDSGAPKSGVLKDAKVRTLFNTHYHIDQTGNNEVFAAAGAKIIAHERTREWMSTDYWVPAENRYENCLLYTSPSPRD